MTRDRKTETDYVMWKGIQTENWCIISQAISCSVSLQLDENVSLEPLIKSVAYFKVCHLKKKAPYPDLECINPML